ncbi:LytR C-terminal domain-containing protein [Modestobacter lapidis]|nr:LytR C-terminal domain-containing protein [Modestobacter lapidis]
MSEPSDRSPVRARSGRRPVPGLIFLLVLALAALGVWWNVLRQDAAMEQAEAAACTSAAEAPPSLDPASVTVRVFNATSTAGLANTVADSLQGRGFTVSEIGNDPNPDLEVTGAGELRYGRRGAENASFVRVFLPGIGERPDTRADAVVDVVLGPEFQQLASPEEVAAALAPAAGASTAC